MKTGEGKTLVATLPVYLNALAGKGVHVVTVNDYLAKRDADWMGQIYNFLGLTVGVIVHGLDDEQRKAGLRLRRHLRHQQRARLRLSARQHEVPARGHGPARPHLRDRRRGRLDPGRRGAHAADHLRPARRPLRALQHHRHLHPAARQGRLRARREAAHRRRSPKPASRSSSSCCARPGLLKGDSLYDVENVSLVHHVNQALRAHKLFQRDKDYIVRNGEVVIIDEFTGRMMPGRRYSEGLHQALEAKEHVSRSSPRTRRSPRSPSRTTSACTRSSPA